MLALDLVRSMKKSKDRTLNVLYEEIRKKVQPGTRGHPHLEDVKPFVSNALDQLTEFTSKASPEMLEMGARDLAMSLARTYISADKIADSNFLGGVHSLIGIPCWQVLC